MFNSIYSYLSSFASTSSSYFDNVEFLTDKVAPKVKPKQLYHNQTTNLQNYVQVSKIIMRDIFSSQHQIIEEILLYLLKGDEFRLNHDFLWSPTLTNDRNEYCLRMPSQLVLFQGQLCIASIDPLMRYVKFEEFGNNCQNESIKKLKEEICFYLPNPDYLKTLIENPIYFLNKENKPYLVIEDRHGKQEFVYDFEKMHVVDEITMHKKNFKSFYIKCDHCKIEHKFIVSSNQQSFMLENDTEHFISLNYLIDDILFISEKEIWLIHKQGLHIVRHDCLSVHTFHNFDFGFEEPTYLQLEGILRTQNEMYFWFMNGIGGIHVYRKVSSLL